jgi:hypothetical protein
MEAKGAGGAHVGIRTRDLFLTKEVLCRLSYVGKLAATRPWKPASGRSPQDTRTGRPF